MKLVQGKLFDLTRAALVVFLCLAPWLSGCGGKANEEPEAPEIRRVSSDKLPALDEYIGPLDVGKGAKLELAGPKEWKIMSRESKYVARFVKGDQLGLPRILITVEAGDVDEFETADEENVVEFAEIVGKRLKKTKAAVLEPARPMMIGPHAFARYVLRSKFRDANIERQVLQTLVAGQLYTIDLQVADGEILKHRDAAYAVAAGLKFTPPREAPGP